ncbi:hypothetical protein A7E78_08880 [Syntrophotalea acetylenivorans]|uniref:Cache domain-containing protein n=1 Tax=Syntrophotalea acetylenivorans TaxID=1842532 RepID=A0A1L3GPS7_9BACT|nr:cache domain-containing protein [Syntrophotalea acetylenivorans]APG27939.1 hypothetical protein A7E78_08880 [Syntrophotalea acetylenivorans]
MDNTTAKNNDLVPFHARHNLLMLVLLFTIFLAFCFLLVQNFRVKTKTEQQVLQNHFSERAKSIDGLLGNIRSQVRTLQLGAEADLANRARHQGQPVPLAFGELNDNSEGNYFHLDDFRPLFSEEMVGNLTGMGSIEKRSPDFYREMHMALDLNHRFHAIHENFTDLAWVYYLSKNDFINIYPWVSAADFRYSSRLKEHDFYQLGLPEQNPTRQTFWTQAYLDEYGKGLMTTCSAPVYDGKRFLGIVAIDLTTEYFSSLVKDFETDSGSLLLTNKEQQVLAHPNLINTASASPPTLQETLPDQLLEAGTDLESLPAWQLNKLGSWSVLRAPWKTHRGKLFFISSGHPCPRPSSPIWVAER